MALKILGWVVLFFIGIFLMIVWHLWLQPIVRRVVQPDPLVVARRLRRLIEGGPLEYGGMRPHDHAIQLRNMHCVAYWILQDDGHIKLSLHDSTTLRKTLLLFKDDVLIKWRYHGVEQPVDAEISEVLNQIYPVLQSVAEKD